MGLFGSKKPVINVKIGDAFSDEDRKQILSVIGPKVKSNYYGKDNDWIGALEAALKNKFVEFDYNTWTNIMLSSAKLMNYEPDLAPLLRNGIDKYKALSNRK